MPGLPFQQNELQNLALSFTSSRQPPNPLYGSVAALDGICIEEQKPLGMYGHRDLKQVTKFCGTWQHETVRR
jgi:hypothetical protein